MIVRYTASGVLAAVLIAAGTSPIHAQNKGMPEPDAGGIHPAQALRAEWPADLTGGDDGGGAGAGVTFGACCAEGSCFHASGLECLSFGGNFAGPDTDCVTFTGWPNGHCEGACCLDDGTCAALLASFECEFNIGGDYQGNFTDCTPSLCSTFALGACCVSIDDCQDAFTEEECLTVSGEPDAWFMNRTCAGDQVHPPINCGAPGLGYYWSCLEGGELFDAGCWVEGTAPGVFDTAIFDIGGIYDVSVNLGGGIDRAIVRSGFVTLDTGPSLFSIIGFSDPFTPSLVIGDGTPSSAALTISGEQFVTDTVHVATAPSSFGTLDIAGAGTSWFGTGSIELGRVGIGMMSVAPGAAVTADRWILAVTGSATAQAVVSGPDTAVTVDDVMTVGKGGFALLDIEDGAIVESGDAIVGQQISTYASVEVRGPGTAWTIYGTLDVALSGQAQLAIADGAAVSTDGFAVIGTFSTWLGPSNPPTYQPAVGVVTIDGPDSLLDVGGDLHVGFAGQATLLVSRGARVLVGGDLLFGVPPVNAFFENRVEIAVSNNDEYWTTPVFDVGGLTDDFDVTVELVDGYVPTDGDTIRIVSAALGLGVFTLDLPPLDAPLEWIVDETTTDLTIIAAEPMPPRPVPGDANGDGLVNVDDIVAVVLALGPCPDPPDPCPEDVDGSGAVDVDDIVFVVLNFD